MRPPTRRLLPSQSFIGRVQRGSGDAAGFWIRLAASLVDIAIYFGVLLIWWVIGVFATGAFAYADPFGDGLTNFLIAWVSFLYFMAFAMAVGFWVMTGIRGQTPGKLIFRIKVIDEFGDPPGMSRALLREGLFIFKIANPWLWLGFISCVWDDERKAMHDILARTTVITDG